MKNCNRQTGEFICPDRTPSVTEEEDEGSRSPSISIYTSGKGHLPPVWLFMIINQETIIAKNGRFPTPDGRHQRCAVGEPSQVERGLLECNSDEGVAGMVPCG